MNFIVIGKICPLSVVGTRLVRFVGFGKNLVPGFLVNTLLLTGGETLGNKNKFSFHLPRQVISTTLLGDIKKSRRKTNSFSRLF